ncbi:MAG: bifunctional nicotinamidase/pyrazinamidase [Pseudomonadota bacterium]
MAQADALIIVDVQQDFCPGGALAVPDGDAIVPVINRLARHVPCIIASKDWHPPGHVSFASSHKGKSVGTTIDTPHGEQILWPDHCVQQSPGAGFHADLNTGPINGIIHKGIARGIDSYSAFKDNCAQGTTGLAGYLRERDIRRIFIVGLALDYCVLWTARDARDCGFEVAVIPAACRALDHDKAMAQLRKENLATVAPEALIS